MDFADLGRSDPIGTIKNWQAQEQQAAVSDLQIGQEKIKLQDIKDKRKANQDAIAKANAPKDWGLITNNVLGGSDGLMGQWMTKTAQQMGYVQLDQQGNGITSATKMQEFLKAVTTNPVLARTLGRTRISQARLMVNQAKEVLVKKPDDEKAKQAYANAGTQLEAILRSTDEFEGHMKTLDAEKLQQQKDKNAMSKQDDQQAFKKSERIAGQEFESQKPETKEKLSVRDSKIESYVNELKVSREEATKLADNIWVLGEDKLGNSILVDKSTGAVRKILSGSNQPEETPEEASKPFITPDEAKKGVGLFASGKQLINNLVGGFVPGQIFEETEESRNKLNAYNQKMRPLLQVSSKGAKFDVDNINKILPNVDKIFQDPDSVKSKFRNIYSLVNGTIKEKERLQQGKISAKQYEKFSDDINQLKEALSLIPSKKELFDESKEAEIKKMSIQEIKKLDYSGYSEQEEKWLLERVRELKK